MAEGQEAGIAQQQVEAQRGDREDEPVGEQHRLVRGRQEGQGDEERYRGKADTEQAAGPGAEGTHARPKRPAGRTRSTTAAMR